jgi:CDP-4-dehydro-6-deoxyglucose reductase, E3
MPRRRNAELVAARSLSPSVRSLTFRTGDGAPVGHVAGQYLDLIVPTARGLPFKRSYSIASPPDTAHPDRFELAVTRVAGGPTSEALHALPLGGRVEIEGPRGTFVRSVEDRAAPALFVGTGTGLAPLRAMLAEEVTRIEGSPCVLLFGCRTPDDVLWADELGAWERASPRFQLQVTLSRPPAGWAGRTGYVQKHVVDLARSLPDAHAYVCGLSAMVDDVVGLLERTGTMPRAALHYEVYD